jgi:hypothetical protein
LPDFQPRPREQCAARIEFFYALGGIRMPCKHEQAADGPAIHFKGLAQHYRSLSYVEPHGLRAGLFAVIAADYAELADLAAGGARVAAEPAPLFLRSLARWLPWIARHRRTDEELDHPLSLPPAATGAK